LAKQLFQSILFFCPLFWRQFAWPPNRRRQRLQRFIYSHRRCCCHITWLYSIWVGGDGKRVHRFARYCSFAQCIDLLATVRNWVLRQAWHGHGIEVRHICIDRGCIAILLRWGNNRLLLERPESRLHERAHCLLTYLILVSRIVVSAPTHYRELHWTTK